MIHQRNWLHVFHLGFICTQWNGLGFGTTLSNWEVVKVEHKLIKNDNRPASFNLVIDTENQYRTVIYYKSFFECMLEVGIVAEVI